MINNSQDQLTGDSPAVDLAALSLSPSLRPIAEEDIQWGDFPFSFQNCDLQAGLEGILKDVGGGLVGSL